MQLSYRAPLWFYPHPVDFRRQIDGLVLLIADELDKSPTSFLFRNQGGNKLKLLWYDEQGFWLCYKRLEKGKLTLPKDSVEVLELNRDELSWLLSGLDFMQQKALPRCTASRFF